jgi:hypothetical protein
MVLPPEYTLNCTDNPGLGCQMSDMGGTMMSVLNVFGDPVVTIIFYILILAAIFVTFLAIRRSVSI